MIFRSTRLGRFSVDLIDSIDQLWGLPLQRPITCYTQNDTLFNIPRMNRRSVFHLSSLRQTSTDGQTDETIIIPNSNNTRFMPISLPRSKRNKHQVSKHIQCSLFSDFGKLGEEN